MPSQHKYQGMIRLRRGNCDRLPQPYSSSANAAIASHLRLRSLLSELSPAQWQGLKEWGEKEGVEKVVEKLEEICKEGEG